MVALDEELHRLCREEYAYESVLASDLVREDDLAAAGVEVGRPDGGEEAASASSYMRMDQAKFQRMGVTKALFILALLRRGHTVLVSDADTVWLEDPWRWLAVDPAAVDPSASSYAIADVLLTNDYPDAGRDNDGTVVLNTGVLLVRPTAAGLALMIEWAARNARAGRGGNDQTELNRSTCAARHQQRRPRRRRDGGLTPRARYRRAVLRSQYAPGSECNVPSCLEPEVHLARLPRCPPRDVYAWLQGRAAEKGCVPDADDRARAVYRAWNDRVVVGILPMDQVRRLAPPPPGPIRAAAERADGRDRGGRVPSRSSCRATRTLCSGCTAAAARPRGP